MAEISYNLLTSTMLNSNIVKIKNCAFKTSKEIPAYCIALAHILTEQPIFKGDGSISGKCKVIQLDSFDDARICDIFNDNSFKILGQQSSWHIHSFGVGRGKQDSNRQWIRQGLTLCLYEEFQMCSLDTLKNSYEQVLESMTSGWLSSQQADNPDITFQENLNEFALFIKKKSLIEEDKLIRFIAGKFSMSRDVKCRAKTEHYNDDDDNGKLYLWIRKCALEDVIEKFGFKF